MRYWIYIFLIVWNRQGRRITEEWLTIYNTERPHEALNNMTPLEY
ncbi:integrase core domain-containing protein [Snodgrassella communis]